MAIHASTVKRKVPKVDTVEVAGVAAVAACVAAAPASAFAPVVVYPAEQAFQQAVAPLRSAAEAEPQNAEARFRFGYAYYVAWHLWRVGLISYGASYDQVAEREFRAAIAANPQHLGPHLLLYELYQSRGDWKAAQQLWPALLALLRGPVGPAPLAPSMH